MQAADFQSCSALTRAPELLYLRDGKGSDN